MTLFERGSVNLARTLSSLRHRDFRLLFVGTSLSHVGDFIQVMAQSWLVYRLSHSELLLGMAWFCSQIPVFALGSLGGVVSGTYPLTVLASSAAQVAVGVEIVCSILYAKDVLPAMMADGDGDNARRSKLAAALVALDGGMDAWTTSGLDVVTGCVFTDIVAWFIIVACASTLYVHGYHNISDAKDAAQALHPLAGDYAYILFAMGLFNASLFAASILPLSTAYAVCEGLGFESGLDKKFSEASVFYWLYTVLVGAGAGGKSLVDNLKSMLSKPKPAKAA